MPEPRPGSPRSRANSFAVGLALLVLLGLAVRVGYVLAVAGDREIIGDALSYHLWAEQIAQGNGMVTVSHPQVGSIVTDPQPSAELAPLFPHLLGVVTWMGVTSVLGQKLVMAVVGTITVALLGLAGREAGGDRVGLLAAGIAAVYPFLWVADGSLMSESLYGVWLAAILLVAIGDSRSPTIRRALLLGALIGLAGLTRGEALALGPLVAFPLGWMASPRWTRRAARVGASALACLLVLTPWTVRNLREFEEPVLVATNSNAVFVGANCEPVYFGEQIGLWSFSCYGEQPPGDESERAVAYRQRGFDYAREHADRLPKVLLARSLRMWELFRPLQQARYETFEGRPEAVSRMGLVAFYPLLVAAAVGAASIRRRRDLLVPLVAPIVVVCGVALVVYGVTRFRFTAEPSLVVLGALGIDVALRRWRRPGPSPADPVEGDTTGGLVDEARETASPGAPDDASRQAEGVADTRAHHR